MSEHTPEVAHRFMRKTLATAVGCVEWQGAHSHKGYGEFWLDGSMRQAHRVAWEIEYGPIPEGMWVLHSCDNRGCVNPKHLFLGTHRDNMADMVAKGRGAGARGARNGNASLTEREVSAIRFLLGYGESQRRVAQKFGVSQSLVGKIARREVWAHV